MAQDLSNEKADGTSMHLEASANDAPHSKLDAAVSDPRNDPEWQDAQKRLVRKLDMTLIPMVWVLYMFNYLDRNNIA